MKSKKISDSNKKNTNNINWYLLIAVAIIVGAMIGFIATNSLSGFGRATLAIKDVSLNKASSLSNYQSGIYNNPLELRLELVGDSKGTVTRYTLVNSEVENSESIKPDCKGSGSIYNNESISLSTEGKYFLSTVTCQNGKPVSEVTTYIYSLENLSPSPNSPINPDEPADPDLPEDPVTDDCVSSGNGSSSNPKVICTASDLDNIRNHLDWHYILGQDIELGVSPYNSGDGWIAIGTEENPFTGSLDGDGYRIMHLYSSNQSSVSGLFGRAVGSTFENLILYDVNIVTDSSAGAILVYSLSDGEISHCDVGGYIYSAGNTGGLAGVMYDSEITDSSFYGSVESLSSVVGGLVGYAQDSVIENSNATIIGTVHGMSIVGGLLGSAIRTNIINSYSQDGYVYGESNGGCVGGLIGNSDPSSNIYNSHSNLDVYGDVGLGGLVGCMGNIYNSYSTGNIISLNPNYSTVYSIGGLAGAGGIISNSFARGNITIEGSADKVGGLVGLKAGPVTNSYSTGSITISGSETNVGGLIGKSSNTSLVTSSYWDTQSSGRTTSAGGTGKTTAEMKQQSTFVGWDFTNIWDIDSGVNGGYPNLEGITANVAGVVATPTASANSGTYAASQSVTLSSSTPGSTIYYTTGGENLTCGNGTAYTGTIPINSTTTLNAIACKSPSGNSMYIPSNILEATYIIENPVSTPTATPAGGTYSSAQSVNLSTTTANATIKYTVNGTNPTCSTGTTYSSPITISETKTLKAIACKTGNNSEILSNTYVIEQATGDWEWAKKIFEEDKIIFTKGVADNLGNIYITGRYVDTNLSIGSFALPLRDNQYKNGDTFIAKLDSQGNFLWVQPIGGNWGDSANGISLDNSGNIFITGYFVSNTVYFGDGTNLSLQKSGNGTNIFVAKLNNNGNWLWAKKAGDTADMAMGQAIAVDSQSNIYVTGYFQNQIKFPGLTFDYNNTGTYYPTLYGYGYSDVFVAKMDSSGNWLWAKKAGGAINDIAQSIAVDSQNNVYIAGTYVGNSYPNTSQVITFGPFTFTRSKQTGKIFIAKLDSSGNWLWVKTTTGMGDDFVSEIVTDNSNNIYAVGSFKSSQGSTGFGSTNLTTSGQYDIFVSKLNSSGDWLWTKKAGGSKWDFGLGIDADSSNVYITGFFVGTAIFGNTTLVNSMPQTDPNDPNTQPRNAYFAKLSAANGSWISAEKALNSGATYSSCANTSIIQNGKTYWFGTMQSLETPIISLGEDVNVSCGANKHRCMFIAKKS